MHLQKPHSILPTQEYVLFLLKAVFPDLQIQKNKLPFNFSGGSSGSFVYSTFVQTSRMYNQSEIYVNCSLVEIYVRLLKGI